ncbi:hypothetical protein ACFWPK_34310 [Nocardia sp. NPDC058519]|uniref:hypothetical protein n=1 Tax=Nocardia sp. NPDC058519 TaxID=3346535 RepID=UPI003647971A
MLDVQPPARRRRPGSVGRQDRGCVMPWFRVDDDAAFHSKIVAAGNAAVGLWTRAGSYSSRELTDGFIPNHMIASMGTPAQAKKLVQVRLWDKVDGGYQFHQWEERQPFTKADVERKRDEARERMRNVRANKSGGSRDVRANEVVTEPPMSEFLSEKNDRLHSERFISENDMSAPSEEGFSESPQVDDASSHEHQTEHDANTPRSSLNPIPSPSLIGVDLGGNRSVGDRGAAANEPTPTPSQFHPEHPDGWVDGCRECEAIGDAIVAHIAAQPAKAAPPERCPAHLAAPTDTPCGPCGVARKKRAEWDRDRQRHNLRQGVEERHAAAELRARAIAECTMCDPDGYRATTVCDHVHRGERRSWREIAAERKAEGDDQPGPSLRSVS